jgi:AAA ATPase domain
VFQQQLPLVGRDADLRLLELVLGHAAAGTGSVALISGEAGIGKTRLCQELGRSQRDRGSQVLLGRAFPEETAISFGAVADTLRAARRGEPPMWQAASARASVLWAIAPELATISDVERRSFDHPVLFEALLDAVDEAAGDRVTLWVLEDLHWADEATWEFVRYAARRVAEMGLVLAATYRAEEIGAVHPWWGNVVRLQRDPSVVHFPLQRLSAADRERLVGALAPSLPQELVATILQRSAGTPLLVQELASLAARSGAVPDLPDIVRATVRERARRLDPAARELLEVAAVAGLEVDQDLLQSMRPDPPADELIAAGLLEREGVRLRFRHPLLREAAYQDVPSERRRAMHQELAEALAWGGAHPAERIAGHLERAGRPQTALSVLDSDAEEALKAGNVGRSATLHLAALQLAGRHASLAARRAGLEAVAIRELFLGGRWTELDPLVHHAWSRRDRLQLDERAWLANALAVHLFWTGAVDEARALIEQELAHLEHNHAPDRGAMLLAQAGFVAEFLAEDAQALWHTERALEIAERTGDVEAECRARYTQIYVLYGLDRDRQAAIARSRDNVAFAHVHGLPASQAAALYSMAEYTARIEDAEAAQQAAERAGAWDYANLAQLLRGIILLFQGRADEAEAIFVRVGPEIWLSRPASTAPWVDAAEAFLHLHRGDLQEARRLLHRPGAEQAARRTARVADRFAALGWLAWEEDRWEEAAEQLTDPMRSWVNGWQLVVGGPMCLPLHVDALLRLGRPADATATLEAASSQRQPQRFFAAALAAARFRLEPTPRAGRRRPVTGGRGALAVACRTARLLARGAARRPTGRTGRTCAVRADRRRPRGPADGAGAATPGRVAARRRRRGHCAVASRGGGGRIGGRRAVQPRDRAAAVPEPPDHRPPRGPHPDQARLRLTRTDRRVGGRAAQRLQLTTADRRGSDGPAEPFGPPPGAMVHRADVGRLHGCQRVQRTARQPGCTATRTRRSRALGTESTFQKGLP